ncbi:MAG: cytochrome-c oxidase, cbb3-type subunit II [Candidatus Lariskella arthropodorum]|uniref:cytochrome-c oxidase, cbb3-type subunit II n=1 Tax=Candidatus Lariskella endosymbiont of Epinotia ramella TaxID=3066224 RepID=UPI0030D40C24
MDNPHTKIEKSIFLLIVLTIIVTSVGAIVEIFPLFKKEVAIENVEGMRAYTPLELIGFDIYKREGCYGCHSQQIRVLRDEVERYGHYSLAAESMFDFPFVWGSKRTGPDLARIGEKYSDDWHVEHLVNPRSVVPESIMPGYPFLLNAEVDTSELQQKMKILVMLGVPYQEDDIKNYLSDINVQLSFEHDPDVIDDFQKRYPKVAIRKFNKHTTKITEMDALIAYLQGLGNKVDLKTNKGRDW